MNTKLKNIGFISTRLCGTDGVSLETAKWAKIFEEEGHLCFYMAGELDTPPQRSLLVKEAHFKHPVIREIFNECFNSVRVRKPSTTKKIHEIKNTLKEKIYKFIKDFEIDIIIPENALAIPLNIPLGLAITEVIAETGIPTIAHHHDFFWERKRFLTNAVWDYLNMAFPPHLPSIQHVVINSSADNQLSLRTGISATIIPNVMDFDNPPKIDEYSSDIREALGLKDDELLILQPTRVVKRKGIEHSIELVKRLGMKAKLVISHASGDEGYEYEQRVKEYSSMMGVDTLFVSDIIKPYRGKTEDGRKIYTPQDIYTHADLVTYPSNFEGFGNAFLEAIYFKKPIVVNNYSIYAIDIKPKGFKVIELDDYVNSEAVELTKKILTDPDLAREMVEHNYELGRRYYSCSILRQRLKVLLSNCFGV
ncbi:MAG TPA: glycosyltransferase [Candidatus Aerophobetes bacterium]|uniref:Glycosyltransferase n=1 Tax=Aerophobetes bacterium TaxID=2030807 RepID=A0A7V0MYU9_UNCAE|nr:glycosyltransferase [Candidatus Aerophobetes bacterium]